MDDIRAQLDALMGADRNVPLADRDKYRVERKFSDKEVCKAFLCGFCPHEEFRRTKNDCGDCPLLHDEACRRQWEELDDRAKERYGYEADLLKWFDRLLIDLRKRIDANTVRLAADDDAPLPTEDVQRLDNMAQQMNDMLARAATLGEQGDVDGAQAAATEAERLKAARVEYERQAQARANARVGKNLNQQVCKISGLIINNEESRLTDHYAGRNYNSWKKLHEVHAQLLEKQRQLRTGHYGRSGSSQRYDSRPTSEPRSGREGGGRRERDKLLEEEEARGGSRRDRDRDRDRRRSRSRDRRRSRSRDRRDRDRRDDRRGRDRSRERRDRDRRDDRREHRDSRRERSPPAAEPKVENAVFVTEYVSPAGQPKAPLPPLAPVPAPGSVAAPAAPAVALPPLAPVPAPGSLPAGPVLGPAPPPAAGAAAAAGEVLPSGPQMPNVPGWHG